MNTSYCLNIVLKKEEKEQLTETMNKLNIEGSSSGSGGGSSSNFKRKPVIVIVVGMAGVNLIELVQLLYLCVKFFHDRN